ncbi:Sideroflexin-3 [Eufriesea mexicana]|uniref:Sidoreflexin n=1 Tax=Eufriesea mexicana TaxID=516756 RepID=A0A310SNM7_9HYME|nr:PREDICTED: sideroflexin-3 [Eufriesea mexicana]OAD62702.1 Sideroflexin-3 [Eufriesea mexicana]
MSTGKENGSLAEERRIDIEKPYWDQSTFKGRAMHFLSVTNPWNLFVGSKRLEHARDVVTKYRKGDSLAQLKVTEEELWECKYLYDSAFHPDTGEKMLVIGRMSAQVPMNMMITGCMLTFYKTTANVITWQWINQSFNAIVNYTNRSGSSPIPMSTIFQSYVIATGGAVVTALGLNRLFFFFRSAPPLVGRLVPFAAVAAANCVNIPFMRMSELQNGIELQTEDGAKVGNSKRAARKAIAAVTLSRILMASPSMILAPIVMNFIDRRQLLRNAKWTVVPLQVLLCGVCLTFATPLCCALFVQRVPISVTELEPEVQEQVLSKDASLRTVYYNKGL